MTPTIGRIVHYTNLGDKDGKYPPEIQAAIITKVVGRFPLGPDQQYLESEVVVSLHIFYPTGQFDMADIPFTTEPAGSDKARGCWAWAARS